MPRRQRLVVEHIQRRMAQPPGPQRRDHRRLVHDRAARGVHQHRAGPQLRQPLGAEEAARLVGQQQMHRQHVASGKQRVQIDERHARRGLRRAVPGDHPHARAHRDPRHLGGDAAEAEQAERLAGEFHALGADPFAAPHAAVHDRQSARRRPHQGDGVLGHRGVAIALDDVHGDAVLGEFLGMHVAARAGAEKDDVLQAGAAPHDFGRHLAVIVEHEVVAGEQPGQRVGRHLELFVHRHRRVVGRTTRRNTSARSSTASRNRPFITSPVACARTVRKPDQGGNRHQARLSLRAKRSNLHRVAHYDGDCRVATLLAMTVSATLPWPPQSASTTSSSAAP